jgi:hypothetical protein
MCKLNLPKALSKYVGGIRLTLHIFKVQLPGLVSIFHEIMHNLNMLRILCVLVVLDGTNGSLAIATNQEGCARDVKGLQELSHPKSFP